MAKQMDMSPVPPGAMVEVGAENISEGKFLAHLDRQIRRAAAELLQYEEMTDDFKSKSTVTAKITIRRNPGTEEYFEIAWQADIKVPTPKNADLVKEKHGRLLCQPCGSSSENPDQQVYFDAHGRIIAPTGPADDAPTVAGSIRKAAQA